jgi:hypothetical protein
MLATEARKTASEIILEVINNYFLDEEEPVRKLLKYIKDNNLVKKQ